MAVACGGELAEPSLWASAFCNTDVVVGEPVAFEPGRRGRWW
jgi:hypothetical protein